MKKTLVTLFTILCLVSISSVCWAKTFNEVVEAAEKKCKKALKSCQDDCFIKFSKTDLSVKHLNIMGDCGVDCLEVRDKCIEPAELVKKSDLDKKTKKKALKILKKAEKQEDSCEKKWKKAVKKCAKKNDEKRVKCSNKALANSRNCLKKANKIRDGLNSLVKD